MQHVQSILPHHGEVRYYRNFFDKEKSDLWFNVLLSEIRWKQEPVKIFGREIMQPRLTAWYGDENRDYTYSGITMNASPWIEPLAEMKHELEKIANTTFTSALLNLYRDGNDAIGWHRDNEKMLGKEPVIASVSLGAERIFQLREYHSKSNTVSVLLEHGSLLLMSGESQQFWEHRLPRKSKLHAARINITFREVKQLR